MLNQEMTLKSALAAALAKHGDKVGKQGKDSCPGKKGSDTSFTEMNTKDTN